MCPPLLARLIRAFRERFPNVQVSIIHQNNFEGIETILERAELGIGYLAPESAKRSFGVLNSWVIAAAPIGIATAPTTKPKKRGSVTLSEYAEEPFLILDPRYAPNYLDWVRSIFLQTGFEPAQTIPVDSAEGLFTLISAGAGVALLSPLHFEGGRKGVCFRKLTETVDDFTLSLIWNAQRANPLAHNFLDVVKQVLPEHDDASATALPQ
jgi:DNA-binding transcriptional LysR family regulator